MAVSCTCQVCMVTHYQMLIGSPLHEVPRESWSYRPGGKRPKQPWSTSSGRAWQGRSGSLRTMIGTPLLPAMGMCCLAATPACSCCQGYLITGAVPCHADVLH